MFTRYTLVTGLYEATTFTFGVGGRTLFPGILSHLFADDDTVIGGPRTMTALV